MTRTPDQTHVPEEPLSEAGPTGFADSQSMFTPGFRDSDMQEHVTPDLSPLERLREVVETGLPVGTVERELEEIDLSLDELARQELIPATHIEVARDRGRFEPSASKRLARIIRLVTRARITFGDTGRVLEWLAKPLPDFEGATGLQLLHSEEGAAIASEFLDSIDHGIAA